MRLRSRRRLAAAVNTFLLTSTAQAFTVTPVASPNLDLSQLGRVALAGDFDSIATYTYQGQNEQPFTTNGSQALLTQQPNGVFAPLAASDATILAMCPFVRKTGELAGIVVGGNFTSLQGTPAQGIALWDPKSNAVTPLPGLNGSVHALYCNPATDSVFVGGEFHGGNSTNAIVWLGMTGWTNTPFAGFNGPVSTITKSPTGNILFGGAFSTLGNTTEPASKDQQVVNLQGADISAGPPATDSALNDPKSIVCSDGGADGPGTTWLTADGGGGYFRANFKMGFIPSKLRLYNTHYQDRGTKTFRFTAFPINGILNFTYFDPDTQKNESCTNACPLSHNSSVKFQDFHFVNPIGMQGFQLDVTGIYGKSGGLNGIALFQNDIYTYAVQSLNEPGCNGVQFPAKATTTGAWTEQPSGLSGSAFLQAPVAAGAAPASAQILFQPDIRNTGSYTVTVYTPGCTHDNSCSRRGIANVTGVFTSDGKPISKQIYQTNQFDKYDQIYSGRVEASGGNFRPSVTLQPQAGQGAIDLVALKVRFEQLAASDTSSSSSDNGDQSGGSGTGLNGLFDYDPTKTFTNDFAKNQVDSAGASLGEDADVRGITVIDQTVYVAGQFKAPDFSNVFAMENGKAVSLPNGGLNGAVLSMYANGKVLYMAGNFTDTAKGSTPGLNNVAAYDTDKKAWVALGTGVDNEGHYVVPLQLNITGNTAETCVTFNGKFQQVQASGGKPSFKTPSGIAIYVPSKKDWLHNLNVQVPSIHGSLTASVDVPGGAPLLAGTIASQGFALSDAVMLTNTDQGQAALGPLGLTITPQNDTSSKTKRDFTDKLSANFSGVMTGLFDQDNGQNLTILAGHFTAQASDGTTINNLAILNSTGGGNQGAAGLAKGVDDSSTFRVVARNGSTLYAGGQVTGNVNGAINGLVLWDLDQNKFPSQPPALSGSDVAVYAITMRPSSPDLYVGGTFEQAGALPCPSLCYYSDGQWQAPGSGLSGTVSNMLWQSSSNLLIAGNITVQNNATYVATYNADAQSSQWSIPNGANAIPGPVIAMAQASSDGSQYWLSGINANDGEAYLMKYDGSNFKLASKLFGKGSDVRGLSVVSLSTGHDGNEFLDSMFALMITGNIDVPSFGNASAVLYDGSTLTPLILASKGTQSGTLSQVIVQTQQNFSSEGGHMPVGYVVAIALAIALGVMFLLIALGLLIERRRRKAEGYRPAPQNYFEKTANMGRIPPERLFSSLNTPPGQGPRV